MPRANVKNDGKASVTAWLPRPLYARLTSCAKLRGMSRDDLIVELLEKATPDFSQLGAEADKLSRATA